MAAKSIGFTNHSAPSAQPLTYRLVRSRTKHMEGTIVAHAPTSKDSQSRDWVSLFNELDAMKLGYVWAGGVHDLEDAGKIWLLDEYGYMSHFLEPIDAAAKAAPVKSEGTCPKCGEWGKFVRMALVCSAHGAYGGC